MLKGREIKAKIIECGLTVSQTAEELGISRQTLDNKIKGRSEWTVTEYNKLCELLEAPEEAIQ